MFLFVWGGVASFVVAVAGVFVVVVVVLVLVLVLVVVVVVVVVLVVVPAAVIAVVAVVKFMTGKIVHRLIYTPGSMNMVHLKITLKSGKSSQPSRFFGFKMLYN